VGELMKKLIVILIGVLFFGCVSTTSGFQKALNASEAAGNLVANSAVNACNLAEIKVTMDPTTTNEQKINTVRILRIKCDAIYDALDELGTMQEATQSALDAGDLATYSKLMIESAKCVSEIKELIAALK
jgi:hypothetical protein